MLSPIRKFLDKHALNYRCASVVGHPVEEILKAAAREKSHLLVMGTHGHGLIGRLMMGSIAQRVVSDGDIPVLRQCHTKLVITLARSGTKTTTVDTENCRERARAFFGTGQIQLQMRVIRIGIFNALLELHVVRNRKVCRVGKRGKCTENQAAETLSDLVWHEGRFLSNPPQDASDCPHPFESFFQVSGRLAQEAGTIPNITMSGTTFLVSAAENWVWSRAIWNYGSRRRKAITRRFTS